MLTDDCVTQGEVDKLVEQLPKEHREAVARVISIASQGSLCASSPRLALAYCHYLASLLAVID